MSSTVIKVENLSKQYHIGERESYKTFREAIVNLAKAPFHRWNGSDSQPKFRNPKSEAIWALKDVSFQVKQGEVVGIIGRNGAGKSTLLKILSKITGPTEGRVELKGRVGSLLEVGTGFHPELTGHENIYLYGAILGMDRWEVTRKFDEIVAFAEIEKFIDTPVKRYSSGMYVRLAFAVAAYLEPDLLLVDEVLAVGDAQFWSKSIRRMRELNDKGMTILLVSHNMWLIQTLCSRAILLDRGQIRNEGNPLNVIKAYRKINQDSRNKANIDQIAAKNDDTNKITFFQVLPNGVWATEKEPYPDSGVKIVIEALIAREKRVKFLIRLSTTDNLTFYSLYSDVIEITENKRMKCEAKIDRLMVLPGDYLIWVGICSDKREDYILTAENVPICVKGKGESIEHTSLFWNDATWRVLE